MTPGRATKKLEKIGFFPIAASFENCGPQNPAPFEKHA